MGRKLALLVGVSEYGDTLSPLPCAARDVSALAAVLRATQRGGFDTVHELVNPSNDTLQISVESFFRGGQSDDLLLLYFSGHAVKDTRGDLFFATPQTRRSPNGDLQRATATRCSFVHECMDDSRSRRQVIILDCCFSGAFAEGLAAKDDRAIDIQQNFGGEGRAILTSSTSTQYSYARSNSELSEYTGHLVEGIRTGRADLDSDGMISTDELHEYAQKEIRANQHTSGMKPKIFPVREGYKIFVSQAPLVDARTAYCAELRRVGQTGRISADGRAILQSRQRALRLGRSEARALELEVITPIRHRLKNLKLYRRRLKRLRRGKFRDASARDELSQYRDRVLQLSRADVQEIFEEVFQASSWGEVLERDAQRPRLLIPLKAFALALISAAVVVSVAWWGFDALRGLSTGDGREETAQAKPEPAPARPEPAAWDGLSLPAISPDSDREWWCLCYRGETVNTGCRRTRKRCEALQARFRKKSQTYGPCTSVAGARPWDSLHNEPLWTESDRDDATLAVGACLLAHPEAPNWQEGDWVIRVSADSKLENALEHAAYLRRHSKFGVRVVSNRRSPSQTGRLYYIVLGGYRSESAARRDSEAAKKLLGKGRMIHNLRSWCPRAVPTIHGYDDCDT